MKKLSLFIVPGALVLLTALLFMYLLFFLHTPGLASAAPAVHVPHLYLVGSGSALDEIVESNTGEAKGDLVGRNLTPGKSYIISSNLSRWCGSNNIDGVTAIADLNGRFDVAFDAKGCVQNKAHIRITRMDDEFVEHTMVLDLDAPQN